MQKINIDPTSDLIIFTDNLQIKAAPFALKHLAFEDMGKVADEVLAGYKDTIVKALCDMRAVARGEVKLDAPPKDEYPVKAHDKYVFGGSVGTGRIQQFVYDERHFPDPWGAVPAAEAEHADQAQAQFENDIRAYYRQPNLNRENGGNNNG